MKKRIVHSRTSESDDSARDEVQEALEEAREAMRQAAPRVRRLRRQAKSLLERVLERPELLNRVKQKRLPEEQEAAERHFADAKQREMVRRLDLAGPAPSTRKVDAGLFQRLSPRNKKRPTVNKDLRGLVADGNLLAIQNKVEADFQKSIELEITTFVHPIVEEILQGRSSEPIELGNLSLERLAARYCLAVRDAVSTYAEELVRAVSNRRRMGSKQVQVIMQEANRVIRNQTCREVAPALLTAVSTYFRIGEAALSAEIISDALKRFAMPVIKSVAEKIRYAVALHGGGEGSRAEPTPHQKAANPELFRTMTVPEVMVVLSRRRSSVYRYVDEGKLTRGRLRGSITTASVVAFLNKKQEE